MANYWPMIKETKHRKTTPERMRWIKFRLTATEARELNTLARLKRLSRSQLLGQIVAEWQERRALEEHTKHVLPNQ